GYTFCTSRDATRCPSVASRSPATRTPSEQRMASTVVPCGTAGAVSCAQRSGSVGRRCGKSTSSSSTKLEPKYLPRKKTPQCLRARTALLPAALDVVLDELLGVLLEDLVDLINQGVHLLFQLLALLRELLARLSRALAVVAGVTASLLLLLLRLGRGDDREALGGCASRRSRVVVHGRSPGRRRWGPPATGVSSGGCGPARRRWPTS